MKLEESSKDRSAKSGGLAESLQYVGDIAMIRVSAPMI